MPGVFGIDSTSTASDNRISVREQGKLVKGNKNQYTESGAISVGQGGSYQEAGSVNLSGKGAKLNTGFDFSGAKGDITINDTGGATAVELGKSFSQTLEAALKSQSDLSSSATRETTGVVKNLLEKITDTVQAEKTGASPQLLLYLGLGLLGLVAAIFYFRR